MTETIQCYQEHITSYLVSRFGMRQAQAEEAVRSSAMSKMLATDPGAVLYNPPSYWARQIVQEYYLRAA
jgi:hypothetical protein